MSDHPSVQWSQDLLRPMYPSFPSHIRSHSASFIDTQRAQNMIKGSKPRVSMACKHCRQRKVRCDGVQPSCSLCSRLERPCEYVKVTEAENAVLREKKRAARARKATQIAAAQSSASRGEGYSGAAQHARPYPVSRSSAGVLPVMLRSQKSPDGRASQAEYQRHQPRYHDQQAAYNTSSSMDAINTSASSSFYPSHASSSAFRYPPAGSPEWPGVELSGASPTSMMAPSIYNVSAYPTMSAQAPFNDRRDRPYLEQRSSEDSVEYRYRNPRPMDSGDSIEYDNSPFFHAPAGMASSLPAALERGSGFGNPHAFGAAPGSAGGNGTFPGDGIIPSWNEPGSNARHASGWSQSGSTATSSFRGSDAFSERSGAWDNTNTSTSGNASAVSPGLSPPVTERSFEASSPFLGAPLRQNSIEDPSPLRNFSTLVSVTGNDMSPAESCDTPAWPDNVDPLNKPTLPSINHVPSLGLILPLNGSRRSSSQREDNVFVVDSQSLTGNLSADFDADAFKLPTNKGYLRQLEAPIIVEP